VGQQCHVGHANPGCYWETFCLTVIKVFNSGAQVEIVQAKMEKLHHGKSMPTKYLTVLGSLNKPMACNEVTLIWLLKCGIDEKVVYGQSSLLLNYKDWKVQAIKHVWPEHI
jgi:hypothetical protein